MKVNEAKIIGGGCAGMTKNGWLRWQRTLAAKTRKMRKIGMFFMCLLRLFAANPQSPNRVQSCQFYDFPTATVAFSAHFQHNRDKSIEVPPHEPFTRQTEFSQVKPGQAQSRYSCELDHVEGIK